MTKDQLLTEITKRNNPSRTGMSHEQQMLWFVAYQEATNIHDSFTVKDLAHMLLKGYPSIDKEFVDDWLKIQEEEELTDEDLITMLDQFFGV